MLALHRRTLVLKKRGHYGIHKTQVPCQRQPRTRLPGDGMPIGNELLLLPRPTTYPGRSTAAARPARGPEAQSQPSPDVCIRSLPEPERPERSCPMMHYFCECIGCYSDARVHVFQRALGHLAVALRTIPELPNHLVEQSFGDSRSLIKLPDRRNCHSASRQLILLFEPTRTGDQCVRNRPCS